MSVRGDWVDGEILHSDDWNDTFDNVATQVDVSAGVVGTNGTLNYPLGSIVGWLKSFTGTPALTSGWAECNGQTISDIESPYNGTVIPNLNNSGSTSANTFLKESSVIGVTGGSLTHTHYISGSGYGNPSGSSDPNYPVNNQTLGAASNEPPYYDVVWIMRIK